MQKPIAANVRPLPRDIETRMARGLGLDLEPWALQFVKNCQHLRRLGNTGIWIKRRDRAAIALCMQYPALDSVLAQIETELTRFEIIKLEKF